MYVLQHMRQTGVKMPGGDFGVVGHGHGRESFSSSVASSMNDLTSDAGVTKQGGQTGPYLEGNMKLLATM